MAADSILGLMADGIAKLLSVYEVVIVDADVDAVADAVATSP